MTAGGRAFLGAALGALLTIAFHPISRPFLTTPLIGATSSDLAAQLYLRSKRLPAPNTLPHAALWLHMAADRTVANKPLRKSEYVSILQIAKEAANKEPKNAFWPQMRAVFLQRLGRRSDALEAWELAARKETWNDHQSELLGSARDRIAYLSGSHQAWQTSFVYYARSQSAAYLIEKFARSLIADLDLASSESLRLRFVTLQNGSSMRDWSRSIDIGTRGADMVELASYPGKLSGIRSPKRLLMAQIAMFNSLMEEGKREQAAFVYESFRKNDGWRYMTTREDYQEETASNSLNSVFTASLPSAILLSAIVGALLWGLGRLVERQPEKRFAAWTIATVALVLGALTFLLSRNIAAAVVVSLCTAFLIYGPDRGRTYHDNYVGPLFTFLIWLLTFAFFGTFVLYVTGLSLPANAVLPLLGYSGELFGNRSMFIGLSAIILGLVLLTAPAWSLVQKRTTPFMLSLALRRFGSNLALWSLLLVIATTPLCVFWDRRLDVILDQMVGNEPVYHYTR